MKSLLLFFLFASGLASLKANSNTMKALCYGPGLYGNKTASGLKLTPSLVGVAHKSLPLGKKIKLQYCHKEIILPIIDRGPYATSAQLDVTEAAVKALGFKNCADFGVRTLLVELQP